MNDEPLTREELERRLAAAEAELRQRENYFRNLLYTLHEDILVIDRDWTVVDCNNTRLTTTGHTRDEVVGRHCFEVLHGSDVPCEQAGEQCALRQVFATGEPANCHHEHRRKDGGVWHADILFSPLKDASGNVTHVIEAVRDVSDLFEAQEAERRAALEISTMLASINDGFFTLDQDLVVTYYNPAAARALGRPAEKVLGRKLFDAFPEARGSIFEARYTEALRERRALSFETIFGVPPFEGWYEVRVYPSGQGISVFFEVITERKVAEEALRESEARYRLLADNSVDVIWQMDLERRFTYASPSIAKVFGHTVEEFLGTRLEDHTDPADFAELERALARELEHVSEGVILETRLRHRAGHLVPVEVRAKVLLDEDGTPRMVQGSTRDVSERRVAERELRESEERYRRLIELTPDAVFVHAGGNFTFANQAGATLLGADDPEQLLGRPILDFVDPEYHDAVTTRVRGALEEGTTAPLLEERFVRLDGTRVAVEVTAIPFGEGDSPAVQVVARSIEERIAAERELEEALAWQRHVFEGSQDAVFISDADSRFVAVNRAAEELTGYDRAELLAMFIPDLHEDPDLAAYRESHGRILAGEPMVSVAPIRRKDGVKVETEFNNAVIEVSGKRYMHTAARDISERVVAERALRERTEFLAVLIEALPFPVFYKGTDGRYLGCNERFLRFFGKRREEVVGRPVDLVSSPEATAVFKMRDRELFANPGTQSYEIELQDAAGTVRPVLFNKATFSDGEGRVAGLVGSILDLSELRRAEAGERKRLRQLAAVNRVARQAASRLDRGELYEAVATEIRNAFGYYNVTILVLDAERRELVFQSIAGAHEGKITRGYHQSIDLGLTGSAVTTGKVEVCSDVREEARYVPGFDGVIDTLAEVAVPIVVSGEVVAVLDVQEDRVGAFDDTDVQMLETVAGQIGIALANARLFERIQEELAGRVRIEAMQQRLATAVDQAAEAIVITDAAGAIEYVNPAFERVSGYDRNEVLGKNPRILKSGRHDAEFYREMWRRISSGNVWSGVLRNRRKDGTEFAEESVISPIRDSDGTISHFVAVKRDVTREREVEEQLRQLQKLEAIGRLAGGVAHDFNNLLQAMLASTHALVAMADNPTEVRGAASEIEEIVRKGSALTRQLLLFARRSVARRETVDLGEIVSGSDKFLRRLLRENIRVSVEPPPEPIGVEVDRGQIEQVIMNLAVNAADAMPEGGTLRLAAGLGGEGEALFEVADSGVGIPAEMLEKVFEPFFTTKSADRGTGLGLAVVHGIVTQHGGRVDVESEVGVGTTFRITLPLEGTVDLRSASMTAGVAQAAERGSGERVVVVEDNDGVRRLLTRFLERLGYEVTAVGSAEEAEQLPVEPSFDALLSDIMLPGAPGPTVARQLKARWPDLAVILMSGYAEEEVLKEGLSRREFRFLQKPVELAVLARELRAALDR